MELVHIDLFVWAAGFVGHLILLIVLFVRKRETQFPIFTSLIAFSILRSCLLFYANSRHYRQYFQTYWILAGFDEVLQFAVLYESASIVFRPTGFWARDVRGALSTIIGMSIVAALLLTYLASPSSDHPIQTMIIRGKFLAATLITELFVGMMAISARAGLAWKTHIARICQGLGLYSGFCVLVDTSIAFYGIQRQSSLYHELSLARIVVYLVCLGYWIAALWSQAPSNDEMPEVMHRQILSLQRRLEADLVRLRPWK